MKKNLLKTTLLAVAGAGLLATSARAYTPSSTSNPGGFVIGFSQAGNSTDIAGSVTLSNFSTVQTFDLGSVGSNFSTVFGNGFATDSTLLWGAGATNGSGSVVNWISSPETVGSGTESHIQTGFANTTSGTIQSRINAAGNGTNNPPFNSITPIGNGQLVMQTQSGDSQWWRTYMKGGGVAGSGGDWGFYNAGANTQANFGNGISGMTLDVYQVPTGAGAAGTDLGDFSLAYNSGTGDLMLTFTPESFEAVPEPTTFVAAVLAVGGLVSMHIQRRRRLRSAA